MVVGFFSHTMALCSSDADAITAVVTRDIAPAFSRTARAWSARVGLVAARVTALAFLGLSPATGLRGPYRPCRAGTGSFRRRYGSGHGGGSFAAHAAG